ncbi:T9SS type A sorting domain-containing protein [bacterium]|nr:T9SS type A sorting domain-containing protein [bacterium]
MKKYLILLLSGTLSMCAIFWAASDQSKPEETIDYSTAQHPGFFDFYREIKQNQFGEIPDGLALLWSKADARNRAFKKGTQNLTNIKEIGPNNIGGRTRSILIDHTDDNIIFAGSVSGGIWKSTNYGSSWKGVDDFAPTLAVTAITQSPFDKNVLYYTTGEVTGRSTGNVNGLGVFKSTDRGESFEHLTVTANDNFDQTWDIVHSLVYDSTIYVATSGHGLWRSTNAGQSFELIYQHGGNIHELEVKSDTTLLAAVNGVGIVEINETTLEATTLGNGFAQSSIGRISFDYCESYPDVMYAHVLKSNLVEINGCYKSSNGGKTWYTTDIPSPVIVSYSQGWYDFKMAVSPVDTNFVLTSGIQVAYSKDGGSTWRRALNSHSDYHEITFYKNGSKLYMGNDGGVYRYDTSSVNLENTVENLNNGYNVTQYYAGHHAPSKNEVIAGSQDNGTHYSFNGNSSFAPVFGADGSYCAVHQQDPDILYFSYQNMNIRRRENNNTINITAGLQNLIGLNEVASAVWFIHPFEVNSLDGDQIIVPTKREVYRSNNKGLSWAAATENLPGNTFCVGLSNEVDPIAYFGGNQSTLFYVEDIRNSTPGDEEWLYLDAPAEFRNGSMVGCIKVDPTERSTIYVGITDLSAGGKIWRVKNANTDNPIFENLHSNLPELLPINWIEVDPENPDFILIGTEYGLYTSNNGGGWWEKETRFPNVCIDQMRLRSSDRRMYIFTHGRGAWMVDLLENPVASVTETESVDINVYPNPTSDFVKVSGIADPELAMYNNAGQVVLTGRNQLDIRNIPNGTYFVEAKNGDKKAVKKIIVLR